MSVSTKQILEKKEKFFKASFHEMFFFFVGMYLVVSKQWMSDDGYVFFRYVDNFLSGFGVVFNKGEYVEGYTSVLWLAILTILKVFLPFTLRQITFLVGYVVAMFSFFLLIKLNMKVVDDEKTNPPLIFSLPLLLTVGTGVVTDFFTSGLETPLVIFYSILFSWQIFFPSPKIWYRALLAGIAFTIRPDFLIFTFFLIIQSFFEYKFSKKMLLTFALSFVIPCVVTLWRIWYYAALLPNTYYVKASDSFYTQQGWFYLLDLIYAYHSHVTLLIIVLAILSTTIGLVIRKNAQNISFNIEICALSAKRWFLLFSALLYGIYVVLIGGDFMHGRFWLPVLVMLYCTSAGLPEGLLYRLFSTDRVSALLSKRSIRFVVSVLFPLLPLSIFMWHLSFRSLQTGGNLAVAKERQINQGKKFHKTTLEFGGGLFSIADERACYSDVDWANGRWDHPGINEAGAGMAKLAQQLGTLITVHEGVIGSYSFYAGSNVRIIDELGLVDPFTAKIDIGERRGRPGHEKRAPLIHLLRSKILTHPHVSGYARYFEPITTAYPIILDYSSSFVEAFTKTFPDSDLEGKIVRGLQKILNEERPTKSNLAIAKVLTDDSFLVGTEIKAKIDHMYDEIAPGENFNKDWLEMNKENYMMVEEQMYNKHNVFENIRIALRNHSVRFSIPKSTQDT